MSKTIFSILIFVIVFPNVCHGGSKGAITGLVVDNSGSPITGVKLIVRSKERQTETTAQTNEIGRYRIVLLPPGKYSIIFSHPDYNTSLEEFIFVHVNKKIAVNVCLDEISFSEPNFCFDHKELIDPFSSSAKFTIEKEFLDRLP